MKNVLHRVKGDRTTVLTIETMKADWIGQILHRKYLLKHVTEGKIEGRIEVKTRKKR